MATDRTLAARQQAMRDRREREGLKRLELWARPEHHAAIRAFSKSLQKAIALGLSGATEDKRP